MKSNLKRHALPSPANRATSRTTYELTSKPFTKSAVIVTHLTSNRSAEVPKELLFGDKIDFHRWSLVLNDDALKELSEQATSGKRFFIDCNATLLSGMFRTFWEPKLCPSGLLELNISAACEVTDYGITLVARASSELRSLNISGCVKITDIGLREVALNCGKLQYLNISSCSKIEGNGLLAVAEMCQYLSKLSMAKCSQIQNWSLQRIFRKCFRLEQVKISHMRDITDEEIRVLAEHCPDLTTFVAIECPYLSDQCILSLTQNCRDLDVVDLSRTDMTYRVSDVSLMALGQRATSLRVLKLNGCDTITDVGIGWLSEGCRVLETLELYGCKKVTDAGLRVLGTHCHALTELDISSAKSISDVGLSSLSRGCRALKKLLCAGAIFLSDPRLIPMAADAKTKELVWEEHIGVMALTIHCPELEHLDVSGCFRLNKVFQYGVATLKQLKTLNIQGCNQVSSTSLIALAAGCRQLESINMSDCGKGVNNEVLLALSQQCPRLKSIVCCRNKEVKGMGIKGVANLRFLEKLDLSGCASLTDSMLVHLSAGEKVPNLTELNLSHMPKISDSVLAWMAMKDHKLVSFNFKGSPISLRAVQSIRDRFEQSDVVNNDHFFGFQPKFRVQDRLLIHSYHRTILGITKIQARVRKMRAIRRIQSMQYTNRVLYSQALLQRVARGFLARRRAGHLRRIRQRFDTAACRITHLFRVCVAKKQLHRLRFQRYQRYLHAKAGQLQLRWRCHRDTTVLKRLRQEKLLWHETRLAATIVLQSLGRMYLAKCRTQQVRELQKLRHRMRHRRACTIQRCFRGHQARLVTQQYRSLLETLEKARLWAAKVIQRAFRLFRTRRLVAERHQARLRQCRGVVRIQALMRGALARLHTMEKKYERSLLRRRWATVKIQCLWRVFKARSVFFEMIREKAHWRAKREAAATVINRAARMKLAWSRFLLKRREYRQRLRQEAATVLQAATKIQALMRRYLGRLTYFQKLQEKKSKWKELFDEDQQKRFFYNKQTGEIRWRIPQDLLDLIPHPICDDCHHLEAALECRVCNELFCGDCFARVHSGGRRKEHDFRALYDFYGKRLDYGDGDFPCQWPSEVIQDEVQGWMLRVAPYRHPTRVYAESGWEEYALANDLLREDHALKQQKTMLGRTLEQHRVRSSLGRDNPKVFYFNRRTFATSYAMPPEVEAELYPPHPPATASFSSMRHTGEDTNYFGYGQQQDTSSGNMVGVVPQYYQTTNAAGETQYYMMTYPQPQPQMDQGHYYYDSVGNSVAPQVLFASTGTNNNNNNNNNDNNVNNNNFNNGMDTNGQYYLQLAMGTGYNSNFNNTNNNFNNTNNNFNNTSNSNSYTPSAPSTAATDAVRTPQTYSATTPQQSRPATSTSHPAEDRRPVTRETHGDKEEDGNDDEDEEEEDVEEDEEEEDEEEEEEEDEDDNTEEVVALEDDEDYATPPSAKQQQQQQTLNKKPSREYRSYNSADLQQEQQQEYEQQYLQQQQQQQQGKTPKSILKNNNNNKNGRPMSYHANVDPQYYHDLSSESASVTSLVRK